MSINWDIHFIFGKYVLVDTNLYFSDWFRSTRGQLGCPLRAYGPACNRWSSESRSKTCFDYAESRQRKAEGLTQNGFAIEQSGAFGTATQNGRSSERRSNACIDYAES